MKYACCFYFTQAVFRMLHKIVFCLFTSYNMLLSIYRVGIYLQTILKLLLYILEYKLTSSCRS